MNLFFCVFLIIPTEKRPVVKRAERKKLGMLIPPTFCQLIVLIETNSKDFGCDNFKWQALS